MEKRLNKAKKVDATDEEKLDAAEASILMAELLTKIEDAKHIRDTEQPVTLPPLEKAKMDAAIKAHKDHETKLELARGKAFSSIKCH